VKNVPDKQGNCIDVYMWHVTEDRIRASQAHQDLSWVGDFFLHVSPLDRDGQALQ
jgi:hypothetical protein